MDQEPTTFFFDGTPQSFDEVSESADGVVQLSAAESKILDDVLQSSDDRLESVDGVPQSSDDKSESVDESRELQTLAVNGTSEESITAEDTESVMAWQDYAQEIATLCHLKAEEFHLLGYEEVQADEVWECVKSTVKGRYRLHDVVALVMGLQIGKFMNWMTMRAYRGTIEGDVFSP